MDALDRLYRRLAERLRREHPEGAGEALTVAEVYQRLVPYRACRAELGFAELPEYEHALMRLLSGERGYVSLDPPGVQEELRRELREPNPILGMYRDHSAVAVHLHPGRLPPEAPPPPPAVPEPVPAAAALPEWLEEPEPPPAPAPEPPVPIGCRLCGDPLPERRPVRFCPACGASQRPTPCRACGEMVEPEWKFCVGCGVPQQAAGGG